MLAQMKRFSLYARYALAISPSEGGPPKTAQGACASALYERGDLIRATETSDAARDLLFKMLGLSHCAAVGVAASSEYALGLASLRCLQHRLGKENLIDALGTVVGPALLACAVAEVRWARVRVMSMWHMSCEPLLLTMP
jgi:hypothetical protein